MKLASLACTALVFAGMIPVANSQPCPEKNLYYYQAFPAGGESDQSLAKSTVLRASIFRLASLPDPAWYYARMRLLR